MRGDFLRPDKGTKERTVLRCIIFRDLSCLFVSDHNYHNLKALLLSRFRAHGKVIKGKIRIKSLTKKYSDQPL